MFCLRIQRYYTVLSIVNGKLYSANMLLKHQFVVLD